MTTLESQFAIRVCKSCGEEFETEVTAFQFESTLFSGMGPIHCDRCLGEYEVRLARHTKPGGSSSVRDWSKICPPRYRDFDLAKLPTETQWIAPQVLAWEYGSKGVGLMGNSGKGKTFLLYELCRRLFEKGIDIHALTGPEFASICGDPDQTKRRRELDRMKRAEILFIDGFGKFKVTDRVETDLCDVLEDRRDMARPLFLTVNSAGDELARKMSPGNGGSIVKAMRETCDILSIPRRNGSADSALPNIMRVTS